MSEKENSGKKSLRLAIAVAVLIGAIILLIATEFAARKPDPEPPPETPKTGSATDTPPSTSAASPSLKDTPSRRTPPLVIESGPTPVRAFNASPASPPPSEERSALADDLHSPASSPRRDLAIVAELFAHYLDHFRELPVGNNAEITAALAGDNNRGIALLPADHAAISAQGELCDRWGSPYFFHQVSGVTMEVRSSGPDRRRFTADDLVYPPSADAETVPAP